MKKVLSVKEAADQVKSGMTIMVGGFLGVGAPDEIVAEIVKKDLSHLHGICIAADFPNKGIGPLIVSRAISLFEGSHIGTNKIAAQLHSTGELKVNFVPQGTLLERMHAKAAALGGVLVRVGLGTLVEEGKDKVTVDGVEFLLEKPLGADIAIIKAHKADRAGNLIYQKTARNSNPQMAMAADITIALVDEIVECGEIDPECIITPGIFVDYLVVAGGTK